MSDLDRIVRQYNLAFETKSKGAGAIFVKPDLRKKYLLSVPEVHKRVTFLESHLIGIDFIHEGQTFSEHDAIPDEKIKEARVTMRYQIVVSPSSSLKTRVILQKWVRKGNMWFIHPELKDYL